MSEEREVPPEEMVHRGSIAHLMRRSGVTESVVSRSSLSVKPVDVSNVVLENQVHIMKGLALMLDAVLELQGKGRELRVQLRPSNGDEGVVPLVTRA